MKDKYISYYELLGMIKEGNIPKRIYVKIASYGMYYVANYEGEDFNYYELQDKDVIDENYHVYLSECFLESSMFEKCIQVLDGEEFEDIEKLDIEDNAMNRSERYIRKSNNKLVTLSVSDYVLANKINQLIKNQKKIIERLNKEN